MSTGIGQCLACGGIYDDELPCRCEPRNIVEQRAEHYGSGDENLTRIAGLWSAYLGTPLTAHDVCWLMVLLKASRARQDAGQHDDNFLDAHGYLELAERLR